jgi:hypothetical protein
MNELDEAEKKSKLSFETVDANVMFGGTIDPSVDPVNPGGVDVDAASVPSETALGLRSWATGVPVTGVFTMVVLRSIAVVPDEKTPTGAVGTAKSDV